MNNIRLRAYLYDLGNHLLRWVGLAFVLPSVEESVGLEAQYWMYGTDYWMAKVIIGGTEKLKERNRTRERSMYIRRELHPVAAILLHQDKMPKLVRLHMFGN